jgi:hypothetical protein
VYFHARYYPDQNVGEAAVTDIHNQTEIKSQITRGSAYYGLNTVASPVKVISAMAKDSILGKGKSRPDKVDLAELTLWKATLASMVGNGAMVTDMIHNSASYKSPSADTKLIGRGYFPDEQTPENLPTGDEGRKAAQACVDKARLRDDSGNYRLHYTSYPEPAKSPPYPLNNREWSHRAKTCGAHKLARDCYLELQTYLFDCIHGSVSKEFQRLISRETDRYGTNALKLIGQCLPIGDLSTVNELTTEMQKIRIGRSHPRTTFQTLKELYRKCGVISDQSERDRLLSIEFGRSLVTEHFMLDVGGFLRWYNMRVQVRLHIRTLATMDEIEEYLSEIYNENFQSYDTSNPPSKKKQTGRKDTVLNVDATCDNCGRKGHKASTCRMKGGAKQEHCGFCKKFGHGGVTPCGNPKNPNKKTKKDARPANGSRKKAAGSDSSSPDPKKGPCSHCKDKGHGWANCPKRMREQLDKLEDQVLTATADSSKVKKLKSKRKTALALLKANGLDADALADSSSEDEE